jgi:sugar (pentulose or hexulose) kinase
VATLSDSGRFLVGIDCGSQSAKVAIYNSSGTVVAKGQQLLRPMDRPRHGVVTHPDDDLWTSISAACQQALASFRGDRSAIAGVGLCTIRCCKAFLDAHGSLTEPVISWMDDRAYQPYRPTNPAVRYATTTSGYLAHRFTGEFKDTAANNIALQWPIDPTTWDWSSDPSTYEPFGVTRDQLFELQQPGDIVGRVTAAAAEATGLPVGTIVVATANDKAVELLGAGPLHDSTALLSLGTYIAAMVHGSTFHAEPQHFWTNFASVPRRYLYESNGIRRGMWTLTWWLDLLGPEFAAQAAAEGVSREEYLEREAVLVPPGSDGLMTVLDWLAPTDKPHRKGMMLGFDARHTRGHIYRSILEAIALTMRSNVDHMCTELSTFEATTISELLVSGGGSSSDLFMQILADAFAVDTVRTVGGGGASLGAAICAAAATGVHPDIASATREMAAGRQVFRPQANAVDLYRRLSNSGYLHIRDTTDRLFEPSLFEPSLFEPSLFEPSLFEPSQGTEAP